MITIKDNYDRNHDLQMLAFDIAHAAVLFHGKERTQFVHDVVWDIVEPLAHADGRHAAGSVFEAIRQLVMAAIDEASYAVGTATRH